MNVQHIAASIAAELRAHPERLAPFYMGPIGGDPAVPVCFIGHLRKRGCFSFEFPEVYAAFARALTHKYSMVPGIGAPTELMLWNDAQKSAADIIAFCDRVAAGAELHPGFVKLRGDLNELQAGVMLEQTL